VADPGFANGGGKVERWRREYRGAEGAEGGGACGNFFDFDSENGDFWCILGAILQFTVYCSVDCL